MKVLKKDRDIKTACKQKVMLRYEKYWQKQGFNVIAGVDEAGRGPIAGPLVVAAVVLPKKFKLPGLDDSKKVSPKNREVLYEKIKIVALAFAVVIVEIEEIERLNIYQATKKAMQKAVAELSMQPEVVLTDAMPIVDVPYIVQSIIKGDSLSANIAAASILAKVERDRIMSDIDKLLPHYGFKQHKGYGTPKHLEALQKYGVSAVHRLSYAPVRAVKENSYGN